MSIKVSVSVDNTNLSALIKQINNTQVEVGWLDNEDHWSDKGTSERFNIPTLANHLHFYSEWDDTFMFSQTRVKQVDGIVQASLGSGSSFKGAAGLIGKRLEAQLKKNIVAVTAPPNSSVWAARKGNSKPLQWGSINGSTPNLISSIRSEVKSR